MEAIRHLDTGLELLQALPALALEAIARARTVVVVLVVHRRRHGAVEADGDTAYFRLYRNPRNRRSYVLVRRADVAGDFGGTRRPGAPHAVLGSVVQVPGSGLDVGVAHPRLDADQ